MVAYYLLREMQQSHSREFLLLHGVTHLQKPPSRRAVFWSAAVQSDTLTKN
jgi:hypothetical protein